MSEHLTVAGLALAGRFGEFTVSPDGTAIAYVSDSDGGSALWRRSLVALDAPAVVLAAGIGAIKRCVWCPDGRVILVATDLTGAENYRLMEVDAVTGATLWSTGNDDSVRYEIGPNGGCGNQPYSAGGRLLALSCNARDESVFDVMVRDRVTGEVRTVLVADNRYYPMAWSPSGDRLLIKRIRQNIDHDLFVHDLRTGVTTQVTSSDGPARYLPGGWSVTGESIYLATNEGRDVAGLARLAIGAAAAAPEWLATPEHEVDYLTLSADGRFLLWAVNVDGRTELHLRDLSVDVDRVVTGRLSGVLAKVHGRCGFAPQLTPNGHALLAKVGQPRMPTELCRLDVVTGVVDAVAGYGGRIPQEMLVEPEVVRYPSTDGLKVPALLYRPHPANRQRRAPVVVSVHGGPESQEFPEYNPMYQYLLSRGIGILAPNYRGSTGFGAAYQKLVYRDRGGGDLNDLMKAVEYLGTLGWVDVDRLGVYGASYGGFLTVSAITRWPELWAVAVERCGRVDLTSIADNVPAHWERRLADLVGDPDTDAAVLAERSPIRYAHRIRVPLLVIHGENDSRVPRTESDRLVARLRELGKPVEYLLLAGEGHSTNDRDTALRALTATVDWFTRHLLATPGAKGHMS